MRRNIFLLSSLSLFPAAAFAQATYSKEVSRVFQAKCQICHREGDVAPFVLDSYDSAVTWADDIRRMVASKQMPPWKPVPGHGEFRDSWALSDADRQMVLDWIDAGMPPGDPADLPEPLAAGGEWPAGAPDAVLQMKQAYDVPRVKDKYRCFVIPTGFTEDKWINAVQIMPGNRQIVHHVIIYLDSSGKADQLDGKDGAPGYDCFGGPGDGVAENLGDQLAGWAPGVRTTFLPENIGLLVKKNHKLVVQVHYYPGGRPGPDQTRFGLHFSKTVPRDQLIYFPLVDQKLKVAAGDANGKAGTSFQIPALADLKVHIVTPHMHLIGREISLDAVNRDKSVTPMIYINDWDFNWQNFYGYKEPLPLAAGTTVQLSCKYDNSESNPKNPNQPLKEVRWGEGTEDEMCVGFLGVTFDNPFVLRFLKLPNRLGQPVTMQQ